MTLKDIPNCPGYVVSDYGYVFTRKHGGLTQLEPRTNSFGFKVVDLRVDGTRKPVMVHRLVAEVFVPNPDGKLYIEHKNGDQTDNSADNLMWCDFFEWSDFAEYRTPGKWTNEVVLIDLVTENSREFPSVKECSEYLGCKPSEVLYAIRNNRTIFRRYVCDYTGFEVCRNRKNEIIIKREVE